VWARRRFLVCWGGAHRPLLRRCWRGVPRCVLWSAGSPNRSSAAGMVVAAQPHRHAAVDVQQRVAVQRAERKILLLLCREVRAAIRAIKW
jgi:hypothetical protein